MPFPPRQSEYAVGQPMSIVAHTALLPGAAELPRLVAQRKVGSLQTQLRAAEAEIRELERGRKTRATCRRLVERNRAADALALDLYRLRITLDPLLAYSLKFPLYQNWGHGGMRWIFGSLHGRVARELYWAALPLGLLGTLSLAAAAQPVVDVWHDGNLAPLAIMWLLLGCMMIWGYIAVTVKRYHDMDRSGLWAGLAAVPVIGLIWQFAECAFWPGTRGPNRFE